MIAAAITRSDIANYVGWVFYVYIIIIFVYIALNWLFAAGVHPPYSRWSDAVLTFLRDTSEPYDQRHHLRLERGVDLGRRGVTDDPAAHRHGRVGHEPEHRCARIGGLQALHRCTAQHRCHRAGLARDLRRNRLELVRLVTQDDEVGALCDLGV